MYFLAQNGGTLVRSEYLYISGNMICAKVSGSEDVKLAEYEILGEAQEMLHKVYTAIEDGETVFSFEG